MRKAIITELTSYGNDAKFDEIISTIYQEVPYYGGFGGCEYPHPEEHRHEFEYKNAIDCVIKEAKHVVNAILFWVMPSKVLQEIKQ